jgi:hypothetical protein
MDLFIVTVKYHVENLKDHPWPDMGGCGNKEYFSMFWASTFIPNYYSFTLVIT